jgi:phage/plasmid-associated DNA primase
MTLGEMKYEHSKAIRKDICDDESIPYIFFKMTYDKEGDKIMDLPFGWKEWDYDACMAENDMRIQSQSIDCMMINLKKSRYMIIDNDNEENRRAFKEMYDSDWTTYSFRKRLQHKWFIKKDNDGSLTKTKAYDKRDGEMKGIDLLYDCVIERIDSRLYYTDDISYFEFEGEHPFPVDKNKKVEKKEQPKQQQQQQSISILGSSKNMDIVELIDIQFIDNYDTWKRIVWAMKNEGYTEEEAQSISKKSNKYDDDGFSKVWDKAPSNITVSQGTINYYAKLSNEKKYYEIINKNKIDWDIVATERGIAELFLMSYKDDYVYKDETLYIYSKNKWKIATSAFAKNELSKGIKSICCGILQSLTNELKNTEDKQVAQNITARINKMVEISTYCYKTTWINNIYSMLINILSGNDYPMEFDTLLPDVVCFTNKAFNIITGDEVVISKYDYITMDTGYDYIPSTKEQTELIETLMTQIFPTQELRDCYLSILHTCMSGNRPENFVLANGGGRNGKGLTNELMMSLLGKQYSYKGSTTTLTERFKSGVCEEIAQLDKKRMAIFTEPNDNDFLQLGNVKTLTGDGSINARGIYSKKTLTKLFATIIFECNKKPKINGRIDESAISRFINVPFPSTFTNDEEKLKLDNHHKCNLAYKTDVWKIEHRCSFFNYLIKNAKKQLYIPKCIKDETQKYLMDNDDLSIWVEDNYDYDTTAKFIKIDEIYEDYKSSEYYHNMTKRDKQKMTLKVFKEMLQSNIKMRSFYCDRKKIDGVDYKSIILSHKKKVKPSKCLIQECDIQE